MMRLWPLIAVLSLLAFIGLAILSGSDAIARLGNLTIYSFGLTITTLLFAAASLAGAVTLWRARKQEIRRSVRWYSIAVTAALLIAVVYLAYFGVIGIRTWS
jgi:cell division protein FtsW (lipid II flippase)